MNFILSDSGQTVANTAQGNGLKITFATFKLGDGSGYTPAPTDSGLRGNTVYSGNVTSVVTYSASAIDVIVTLPASAGPFTFGEIALYLDTGALFAMAAYSSPQAKLASAGGSGGSTWTIHCILTLMQGNSIVNLIDGKASNLTTFADLSYVTGPDVLAHTPTQALVYEPTSQSAPLHLVRQSPTRWHLHDYVTLGTFTPATVGSSGSYTTLTGSLIAALGIDGSPNRRFVLQNANTGQMCGVNTVSGGLATMERTCAWINTSTPLILHASVQEYVTSIKPQLANATNASLGSGMVGYNGAVSYPSGSIGAALQSLGATGTNVAAAIQRVAQALTPVGSIMAMPVMVGWPDGEYWRQCDGAYLDTAGRSEYQEIKTVLGSTFGPLVGDLVKLPDYRGMVLKGWSGAHTPGTLQNAAFPHHTHRVGFVMTNEAGSTNQYFGSGGSQVEYTTTLTSGGVYTITDVSGNPVTNSTNLSSDGEVHVKNYAVEWWIRVKTVIL